MKKVLVVFGTRPEAIKMAPVIREIRRAEAALEAVVCVTGQHRQILDQMLGFFAITPDIDLDLMRPDQDLATLTATTLEKVTAVLARVRPDITLVQGDTTTAMAAALASFYARVPVGHVEAGLRTDSFYDPFPEEINRRLVSNLSSWHFAPTPAAAERLRAEGVAEHQLFLTGNTVIDALLWAAPRVKRSLLIDELRDRRFILVTAHRRENFGRPLENICAALREIVRSTGVAVVYPVHPNPHIRGPVQQLLGGVPGIHLLEPLGYEQFVAFMKEAVLLLSDSGGVQEEAPSLGKPVLVLRKTTERPEAVAAGVARLVGTETADIVLAVRTLLESDHALQVMVKVVNPFGDGSAARRIVAVLADRLGRFC